MNSELGGVVDKLGFLKAQIADLEARERELKDALIAAGDGSYEGVVFRATVSTFERAQLDKEAVIAELGAKWVRKHSSVTDVTVVNCRARTGVDLPAATIKEGVEHV